MTKYFRGFVACVLLAFGATACAGSLVPVKDFFTRNVYSQPRLSPSGRYLSIVGPDPQNVDRNRLDIVDLVNKKVIRSFWLVNRETFYRLYWVSDRRLVFTTAFLYGGFDRPFATGKIYSVDVRSSDLKLLQSNRSTAGYGYEVLSLVPGDPDHIVTASYARYASPQAFRVNVNGNTVVVGVHQGRRSNPNARRILVSPLKNGSFLADHEARVRLAVGWNRVSGKGEWAYRDTGSSEWTPLPGDLLNAAGDEGPIGFTSDNSKILLLKYGANGGTLGLYTYDPHSQAIERIFGDPQADIVGLTYGPGRKKIVALRTAYARPKIILLDQDGLAAKVLKAFSASFPDRFVNIVSWTRDGKKAIVKVSGDTEPGLYYLVDTDTLHATFLFKRRPDIEPEEMASMKPIEFKARDGLLVHGYLTLPNGVKPQALPMVVFVHGGPHGIRDTWRFYPWVQLLANRGYAVLQINYRGSSGYGWAYMKAGFRHWGTTMQFDLIDGTRWAIKQGYADAKRICIFGASYGGFAALRSSELAPDLYQCTVGYDGVYDLPMMFHKGDITWYSFGPRYLHTVLGDDMAELKDHSPVSHVDKLKSAIYLIQGGSDRRAPPAQVDELKAALDSAGKHYEYLYKENEGHGFYKVSNQRELAKKLLVFFNKYIGG